MTVTRRPALLAVLAVLAGSAAARAEVPLKDLDQARVRVAVAEVLKRPNVQERIKPFEKEVRLSAIQVVYVKAKATDELPARFEWRYEALTKLDDQRTAAVKTLLTGIMADALGNVGRLLVDADATRVLAVFAVAPAEPRKEPKDREGPPQEFPAYTWLLDPSWVTPYPLVSWEGGYGSSLFVVCCGPYSGPVIPPPIYIPVGLNAPHATWHPYWLSAAPTRPAPAIARSERKAPAYRPVPEGATAERLYADALALFWDDNLASARDHLAAAVRQAPRDARLWYFRALAERGLGEDAAARKSAEAGAALEVLGVTDRKTVLTALERVQGADRAFLDERVSGPKALDVRAAREVVERLTSTALTAAR